jgi:hypothetical protein
MQCLFASRISRTFALTFALSAACLSSIPPMPSCGIAGRGGEGTPDVPTARGDMTTVAAPEGAADERCTTVVKREGELKLYATPCGC